MKNLPSLKSLRAFEAAARLRSFSKGAEELAMTQSAVSHQIKTLEDLLGQPLFNRAVRGAALTDAGVDLLLTVQECLALLENGLRRLEQYKKPNQIIIASPRSFAEGVIVPALAHYSTVQPDHNIWLYTEDDPIDPLHGEVFVTILQGRRGLSDVDLVPLCDDPLTPLASPSFLKAWPLTTPQDLLSVPLLFDERREDWQTWFNVAQMDAIAHTNGYNFSDSGLLLQAAADGIGVALGSRLLARRALAEGALVAPFPNLTIPGAGYFMASSANAMALDRVQIFRRWLTETVQPDTHPRQEMTYVQTT